MTGQLWLISTPIGNMDDLPPRAVNTLQACALICCEDTRHSGKLLANAGVRGVRLAVANEHTESDRTAEVLELLAAGSDVAVVTDAGTPGISDPGARLVRAAVAAGHRVSAVPGPAALVMGLVLSGFDTTRFVFEGFLPRTGRDRAERIASIAAERRTVVMYESPHRVRRTVNDLLAACGTDRGIALARELTKLHEETWRGNLADAAQHLLDQAPRGEFVLVVEGASPQPLATDEAISGALRMALASGVDRRTAIATVIATTGAAKRRVYDLALSIPR
ncbi:MAG: 16S rRNA (cytidine(1402)-2'-O)-methyltransferase [Actinobacteria bacterium]|nr:16S rRNA (cytidine(1402)-2'-O)-methyltransferase [Actinomycetota bacterium]